MSPLKKFLLFFSLAVIAARPSIAADSLFVSPSNPTIKDSIKLSIYIITPFACCIEYVRDFQNPNCCIQYVHDSAAVTPRNSTIALSFSESLPQGICNCQALSTDSITAADITYKRGPLPAGNYSVYEESQTCNGLVCPEIIIRTLIGKFTVSKLAVSIYQKKSMPLEKIGTVSGNVCVFDTRGVKVGVLKHTPGVFFVKSKDDISSKLKILF